jgi:hypothetical protein
MDLLLLNLIIKVCNNVERTIHIMERNFRTMMSLILILVKLIIIMYFKAFYYTLFYTYLDPKTLSFLTFQLSLRKSHLNKHNIYSFHDKMG